MKLFFSILFLVWRTLSFAQQTEQELRKIALRYFNIDPYEQKIEKIIADLENNAFVRIDAIIQSTDTSLFYLRGYTTGFNPFGISVNKIEFQVRQDKITTNKKKNVLDTLFAIETIGVCDSTERGKELVKKEFNRLDKEIRSSFKTRIYKKASKKDLREAEICFFYDMLQSPYPELSVGWGGYYENTKINAIDLKLHLRILPAEIKTRE